MANTPKVITVRIKPAFVSAPVGPASEIPEYVIALMEALLHRTPIDFKGCLVPAPVLKILSRHFIENPGLHRACGDCISKVLKEGEE